MSACITTYMKDIVEQMKKHWPDNRTIHIVCHGHSVPSGYFATPFVDTFHSYPHLLHVGLKERYPFAVMNMITTAIGGEESNRGAERFERDVLNHRPDVLLIDYGLNDRRIGLTASESAWKQMIEQALQNEAKVILLTPTWDMSAVLKESSGEWDKLAAHAEQIRSLAAEYEVALCDSFRLFQRHVDQGGHVTDLLSWGNHPNHRGHQLVATGLLQWFM